MDSFASSIHAKRIGGWGLRNLNLLAIDGDRSCPRLSSEIGRGNRDRIRSVADGDNTFFEGQARVLWNCREHEPRLLEVAGARISAITAWAPPRVSSIQQSKQRPAKECCPQRSILPSLTSQYCPSRCEGRACRLVRKANNDNLYRDQFPLL